MFQPMDQASLKNSDVLILTGLTQIPTANPDGMVGEFCSNLGTWLARTVNGMKCSRFTFLIPCFGSMWSFPSQSHPPMPLQPHSKLFSPSASPVLPILQSLLLSAEAILKQHKSEECQNDCPKSQFKCFMQQILNVLPLDLRWKILIYSSCFVVGFGGRTGIHTR